VPRFTDPCGAAIIFANSLPADSAGSANRGSPPNSLCTGSIRPAFVISDWIRATWPPGDTSQLSQPGAVSGPSNRVVSTSTRVGLTPPSAFFTCAARSSSRAAPGNRSLSSSKTAIVASPPPTITTSPGALPATTRVSSR
jgi:hypothetical protein